MGQRLLSVMPVLMRIGVCLALLAAALVVFALLVKTKADIGKVEEPDPPLRVETIRLERVRAVREWEGFGTAQAMDVANVSAEVSSLVTSIDPALRPGSFVEVGDLLIQLDATDYAHDLTMARQAVARAVAQLESLDIERSRLNEQLELVEREANLAQQEYARAIESYEAGAGNQVEVDRRRADLTRAERATSQLRERVEQLDPTAARLAADLESERARESLAQRNVDRCSVLAPLRGQIETIVVDEGDRVGPGSPLVQIVSLDRIEVPLQFPLSARQELAVGDEVELQAEGAVAPCWTARLRRFAPVGRAESRTVVAYAELMQPDEAQVLYGQQVSLSQAPAEVPQILVPGQFVRSRARSMREKAAFVVPRRAVTEDSVFVLNGEGAAERRSIRVAFHVSDRFPALGIADEEWAVLDDASEVRAGDLVIVSNVENLKSGRSVVAGRINGAAADGSSSGGGESSRSADTLGSG